MDRQSYALWLGTQGYTDATCYGYLKVYDLWDEWCRSLGIHPAVASRSHTAHWILERRGLAPSTVRNSLIAVRAYYRYLLDSGLRMEDPTAGLRAPKVSLPPVEPYSTEDLRSLLDAARSPRDRALLLLLLGSGLRSAELLGIKAEDIDWRAGTIRIRGKGNKYRRVAPGDRAMKAVADYMIARERNIWEVDTTAGLRRWIERLGVRAGIKRANLHRFRHTFATLFMEAGGSEGSLEKILGHSSLNMSLHYAATARERVALEQQRRLSPADRL